MLCSGWRHFLGGKWGAQHVGGVGSVYSMAMEWLWDYDVDGRQTGLARDCNGLMLRQRVMRRKIRLGRESGSSDNCCDGDLEDEEDVGQRDGG